MYRHQHNSLGLSSQNFKSQYFKIVKVFKVITLKCSLTSLLEYLDRESSSIVLLPAYGRLTVVKKCGSVSECSGSPSYWWRDECDKRSEEDSYTCTSCCLSTACNQANPSPQPLLALSPLLTVQFLYNKYSSLGWG